jgi:hypothetical protein
LRLAIGESILPAGSNLLSHPEAPMDKAELLEQDTITA